ncbi:MAG: hypothetical protein GY834_11540 [Bacteroidetes bacterium]|nr:hypothetical protein [Bacteroidota bacterium]
MSKDISVEKTYRINLINKTAEEISEKQLYKESHFDRSGNLIKEINFNPPGITEQVTVNEYDKNNNLIKECCFNGDEELDEKVTIEWSSNGKKLKEHKHYLDDSFDTTTFSYNEDGNLIKKVTMDDEGSLEAKELFIYNGKTLLEHIQYNENEEAIEKKSYVYQEGKLLEEKHWEIEDGHKNSIRFEYNSDGKPEIEKHYNHKEQLVKKIEYSGYANDRILGFVEENPYHKNTTKLEYDKNNRIILQEEINKSNKINHRIERIYNEDGLLVETTTLINEQGTFLNYKNFFHYEFFE